MAGIGTAIADVIIPVVTLFTRIENAIAAVGGRQIVGTTEGGTTTGATPTVIFPTPTGPKNVWLTVNDGLESSQCNASVEVLDTSPPTIGAPDDVVEECAAPEDTPVALGSPTVSDVCDPDPAVSNDAPALFPLGDTNVTWTATDDDGNTASVPQMVTVIDTTPPDISCNAVSSITPTDAPISFTASTSD